MHIMCLAKDELSDGVAVHASFMIVKRRRNNVSTGTQWLFRPLLSTE